MLLTRSEIAPATLLSVMSFCITSYDNWEYSQRSHSCSSSTHSSYQTHNPTSKLIVQYLGDDHQCGRVYRSQDHPDKGETDSVSHQAMREPDHQLEDNGDDRTKHQLAGTWDEMQRGQTMCRSTLDSRACVSEE